MDATQAEQRRSRATVFTSSAELVRSFPRGFRSRRRMSSLNRRRRFRRVGSRCARNFGDAMDAELTIEQGLMCGVGKPLSKAIFHVSAREPPDFSTHSCGFTTAKAEPRDARRRAMTASRRGVGWTMCVKDPDGPYADHDGYVPVGKVVDYAAATATSCALVAIGRPAKSSRC